MNDIIAFELLSDANLEHVRAIQRDDISEDFVDNIDAIMELTQYGFDHNCKGHTYAIKHNDAYIGVILLGEAIEWETDPIEMRDVPFYRLMDFVIDKRYRSGGIGSYIFYSLPGGGVEEGEDVLSALKREVLEETGCTCGEIQELGIVEENRGTLDYTQINHYYVVVADQIGELCLTETEQNNRTVIEWCTLPEAVRRITEQDFERVQGKYLSARDIAALEEYQKQYST